MMDIDPNRNIVAVLVVVATIAVLLTNLLWFLFT